MFYKYENEELMITNQVYFPDGMFLHIDILEQLTLPYQNWYYFQTEEEAKAFFGIE